MPKLQSRVTRATSRVTPTNGDHRRDVTQVRVTSGNMANVNASIRLPPFWPARPSTWFAQVENIFDLHAVATEAIRFNIVVANLEPRVVDEVHDIILSPPATTPYTILKQELINRLSRSRDQEVRQLLSREEIGDRTPSQFLRHLRDLAKTDVPDNILRTLWEERLSPHVQAILATQAPTVSLTDIAKLADKVAETTQTRKVASVSGPDAETTSLLVAMARQMEALNAQVEALSVSHAEKYARPSSPRPRSLSRDSRRLNSRSRSRGRSDSGLCWYHEEFGAKAHRCRSPCNWQGNDSGSQH